jgi:hypothetical protein
MASILNLTIKVSMGKEWRPIQSRSKWLMLPLLRLRLANKIKLPYHVVRIADIEECSALTLRGLLQNLKADRWYKIRRGAVS